MIAAAATCSLFVFHLGRPAGGAGRVGGGGSGNNGLQVPDQACRNMVMKTSSRLSLFCLIIVSPIYNQADSICLMKSGEGQCSAMTFRNPAP